MFQLTNFGKTYQNYTRHLTTTIDRDKITELETQFWLGLYYYPFPITLYWGPCYVTCYVKHLLIL